MVNKIQISFLSNKYEIAFTEILTKINKLPIIKEPLL